MLFSTNVPCSSCRTVDTLTGLFIHVADGGDPLACSPSAPPYHHIVIKAAFPFPARGGADFRHHSCSVRGYAPRSRHMPSDHGTGAAVPRPVSLRTRSRPQERTLGSLGLSEYFAVRPAGHGEVESPQQAARVSGGSRRSAGGALRLRCAVESTVATS